MLEQSSSLSKCCGSLGSSHLRWPSFHEDDSGSVERSNVAGLFEDGSIQRESKVRLQVRRSRFNIRHEEVEDVDIGDHVVIVRLSYVCLRSLERFFCCGMDLKRGSGASAFCSFLCFCGLFFPDVIADEHPIHTVESKKIAREWCENPNIFCLEGSDTVAHCLLFRECCSKHSSAGVSVDDYWREPGLCSCSSLLLWWISPWSCTCTVVAFVVASSIPILPSLLEGRFFGRPRFCLVLRVAQVLLSVPVLPGSVHIPFFGGGFAEDSVAGCFP